MTSYKNTESSAQHEKGRRMSDELTPIKRRIIRAAEIIEADEAREIVFQHGIMCQVGLPRRDPKERVFERSFKNASLRVEAGVLWNGYEWEEQPIPYGAKPRLALLYINSEAIKKQTLEIDIGQSYNAFLDKLRLKKGSSFNSLKKQMNALAACKMSFGFTNPEGKIITLKNVDPIDRFEAWLAKDDKQPALWPTVLTLSPRYFNSLTEHAVPLPMEAIAALSHSALSLDLITFIAKRLPTLIKSVRVPDVLLKEQFGQEYQGKNALDDFKKAFFKSMKEALAVYPKAKIERGTGAFIFNPSPPLVSSRGITEAQVKKPLPRYTESKVLSDKTLEGFRALCPRLDVYACKADFDIWLLNKTEPKDYQKAFLGFAKKWGKGKG